MAEYINRDDVIKTIMKWEDKPYFSYHAVLRDVMNLPPADVVPRENYKSMEQTVFKLTEALAERKHGKWKYQTMVHESGIKANGVECSICGATYNLSITLPDMMVEALNFCPNCGARMESEKEDGE